MKVWWGKKGWFLKKWRPELSFESASEFFGPIRTRNGKKAHVQNLRSVEGHGIFKKLQMMVL